MAHRLSEVYQMWRWRPSLALSACLVAALAFVGVYQTVSPVDARQVAPAPGRRMPVPPRVQMRSWSPTASGAAALGTVLNAYGRRFSPAQLEQLVGAAGRKARIIDMEAGTRTAKFQARLVSVPLESL